MTEEQRRQQTGNQPVGPEAGADAPVEEGHERAEPVTPEASDTHTAGASLTIRGDYFDTVSAELQRAYPAAAEAIVRTVVDRGELTFHVRPDHLGDVARVLRDDEALRFELLSSLSGVHYPGDLGAELHVVYQLTSLTHRRLIRLEVAVPDADPHVPSVVAVWPTADFQEREVWDMFGVIFDGHPALTRILMPDDWPGHPQRKDYPLGGVAVQYKGAKIPPPDERRAYA